MARVTDIVILPVVINTWILFKTVSQVLQFRSCVGKCRTKEQKLPFG